MKTRSIIGVLMLGMILLMVAAPCKTYAATDDDKITVTTIAGKEAAIKTVESWKNGTEVTFTDLSGTVTKRIITDEFKKEIIDQLKMNFADECPGTVYCNEQTGKSYCCFCSAAGGCMCFEQST